MEHSPGSSAAVWKPATLDEYVERWRLERRGAPFSTPSSHLHEVLHDGQRALLKVARIEEESKGSRLLEWWGGRGAAPVRAIDDHAVLIDWADGPRSLTLMAEGGSASDDDATRILCDIAERLHAASARPARDERMPPSGLTPLDTWFRSLFFRAERMPRDAGGFWVRGAAAARTLLADRGQDVVLHGDLHHGNVLDFGGDGWLAIDPKFLIGNRVFDYTNILCNPSPQAAESGFARRVDVISDYARIPRDELLHWTVAWTALSAAWTADDGGDATAALRIGALAEGALR